MSDKHAPKDHAKEAAPGKPGMMGQMKVGGVIAAIVLLQCLLAYFLLPSAPTEAAAVAHEKKAAAAHGHEGDAHGEEQGHDAHGHGGEEQREVDLGKFTITSFDQNSNSTVLIDFHLFGTVVKESESEHKEGEEAAGGHGGGHGGHGDAKVKPGEEEDASKFGKLLKKNKHRFRDTVIVTVRNSSPADLSDPALGLIKRQILAKTNSLLGEPMLKEVIFSEFSVVQQ